MENVRQTHARLLALSDLQQKLYADYNEYVAEQDAFIMRTRHRQWEIDETFPGGERDLVRSFAAYQAARTAFLHSSALRSLTAELHTDGDWIAFSARFTYSFALYLWIRNHELLTIRYFVAPHTVFAMPQS